MDFEKIYEQAVQAGLEAVKKCHVTPMYLTDGVQTYVIEEGLCGFASIHFMGNTKFGRWAKAKGIASKGYPKGLYIWVGDFGQSYTRKKAYAQAFAEVLRENGIDAWSESRLD